MNPNLSLPPFYVGQKVVAITNHPTDAFSIGDEFTVTGVYSSCCGFCITIGIESNPYGQYCIHCKRMVMKIEENLYDSTRFRPLESAPLPLMTFSQIKEKEKEEILILN